MKVGGEVGVVAEDGDNSLGAVLEDQDQKYSYRYSMSSVQLASLNLDCFKYWLGC